MKFWDSSALVPLLVDEDGTKSMRPRVKTGSDVWVWALTAVEVTSALWRRRRSGALDDTQLVQALSGLKDLEAAWSVVADVDRVEARARRLLGVHGIRAADALQLAAALVACNEQPGRLPFVTLDDRLAQAALAEGFEVLT
jgi:uncharacterized protein